MVKFLGKSLRNKPTDRLSGMVLMAIIAVTAVLFAAFYLVGFDTPFADDANFNAPVLTDVLLVFIYLLLAIAIAAAAVAVARGLRIRDKAESVVNGVPASRIARSSAILLGATLVVTFALGSAEPMGINGVQYTDVFWLKASDMFINTSGVLLLVAVLAVVYGLSGRNRKTGKKGKG